MKRFFYHAPVKELPDIHLVEMERSGVLHTVAMVPEFLLPKVEVLEHAYLFAKAPEMAHDIQAYRAALGYEVPADHDGKLSDGTTPKCGLCEAKETIMLEGGVTLTRDETVTALNEARRIIHSIGTTGIYEKYGAAHEWMKRLYPNWAD